jgi:hypothetical protein
MKKLRVMLKKRTGNVVEFLKTMREGRFPVAHVPEAKAASWSGGSDSGAE